jgi:hypothetical protein
MFALGIGAACVFVLLLGLRWAWQYTFGALLEALASVRINLPGRHDLHPLRWLRAYNVAVQNDIERRLEKSHRAMGYFFHGAAIIMEWTAREIAGLAADTLHFGQSLSHVRLPRLTRAMIIAAFPLPWLARRVAALVRAHAIPAAHRRTPRRADDVQRVTRIVKATAGAVSDPRRPVGHASAAARARKVAEPDGRAAPQPRAGHRGRVGGRARRDGARPSRAELDSVPPRRQGREGGLRDGLAAPRIAARGRDADHRDDQPRGVDARHSAAHAGDHGRDRLSRARGAGRVDGPAARRDVRDALALFPDFPG